LVNGEAFLPNNKSVQPLVCNYINGQDFALRISKKVNDIYYNIYIGNTALQVGQTYQLTEEINSDSKFGVYNERYPLSNYIYNYYTTTSIIVGELTITHHDFNNAVLSGEFWFDAKLNTLESVNSNANPNEIIEVRDGRFDMEY